jgi:hypothetical protein
MVPGLKTVGYRVIRSNWLLHNATSSPTLTLIADAPAIPFRLKITLSGPDCAGTVSVNSEAIDFIQAGAKLSSGLLTSLPTITTSGLNCIVKVECIDVGGAPIVSDIISLITCRFSNVQKSYRDATGIWTQSDGQLLTTDSACNVGGLLQIENKDYYIKQMESYAKLSGREFLRRLFLEGGGPSPVGRVIGTSEACDMLKSTYDTDADGIVDKAEGIPAFAVVPSDLSAFSDGDMFVVGKKVYRVREE